MMQAETFNNKLAATPTTKRLFLDADILGLWHQPHGVHEEWQDLGAALLLTLASQHGYQFDSLSLKAMHSWAHWRSIAKSYDLVCMNVRSWRFPWAKEAARIAKLANPDVQVWVGGMHCTAAPAAVASVLEFDRLVAGPGEEAFLALLDGTAPPNRSLQGSLARYANPDDLPFLDRTLWPHTHSPMWPLEGPAGWAPGKVATIVTARACPYDCTFCACEGRHFGATKRRSVGSVIEELMEAHKRWGPVGSVIFHDSLFFQQPAWLQEFAERYPKETPNWPYWAATRPDLLTRWPELYEMLARKTAWRAVSIGLESGSDRVLETLSKGFDVAVNYRAIEILNRVGDAVEDAGGVGPLVLANLMLAIPGERPEDARATLAMARTIKRAQPGIAYYSPYPGTVLGDRLIAEGMALGDCEDFASHRPKVKGVDYGFYEQLLNREWRYLLEKEVVCRTGE